MITYREEYEALWNDMHRLHAEGNKIREDNPNNGLIPSPEYSHWLENVYVPWYKRFYELYDLVTQAKQQLFIAEVKADIKKNKPVEPKDMAVTICPEESTHHECLFDIIRRIQDEPHIISGKYCLEQRSKIGEEEKGWHLHLYIQTNVAPTKLKQYILQRLHKRPTINAFVDVHKVYNSAWLTKYMHGEKGSDQDKKDKCEKDKVLRQQYNLQLIYDL